MAKTLSVVNPKLDHHEKVKRLVVLQGEWTIENKLLTPTMKIKRNFVEKMHKANYEFWYDKAQQVVWE